MSKDLYLVPVESRTEELAYGYTVLTLDFDLPLFDRIEQLPSEPIPKNFVSWLFIKGNSYGHGVTTVDAYGAPLVTVNACELAELFKRYGSKKFRNNVAAWKYLEYLSSDKRVVLFWH